MHSFDKYDRYQRQIILKELGVSGQEKLLKAKVAVIGAGGLGCPALQYLAAAGAGTIGIVDFDFVELTNLQRQTLYNMEDIGKPKVQIATKRLCAFNPDINIVAHQVTLDNRNALDILSLYDIVIDGTDNFTTRYLVNDACVLLGKPLIYGAILRYEGQVGVFNFGEGPEKTNYRDLFPRPPLPSTVLSCNEAGVPGVLPGIIGTLQAAEVIKMVTGIGEPLTNSIMTYNLLNNSFYQFQLSPLSGYDNPIPRNREEFERFDYSWFCEPEHDPLEIFCDEFNALREKESITIIDVREEGELPNVDEFYCINIPLNRFEDFVDSAVIQEKTVIFCLSGKRSLLAAKRLKEKFPASCIYSLKGGIAGWKKQQMTKQNT